MDTVIVLFNRDLRVHDHPALAAACDEARRVVPLFVADPAMPMGLRQGFLAECLADLRESLRERGGELVIRRGDPVAQTMRVAGEVAAQAVFTASDVSSLARRREGRLARECATARMEFRCFPGVTVVPPGALRPSGGGDHYRVFTPYWRVWKDHPRRQVLKAPGMVIVPDALAPGPLPVPRHGPHELFRGGETVGRRRMTQWLRHCVSDYADGHDDLAGNRTSKLSPYLRFGCVSPLETEALAEGGDDFVRQLCWRDFFHQVAQAFPRVNRDDYRPRGHDWRDDRDAVQAWQEGMTGVPIVDAGIRQLLAEGWMHNRARMIVSSFLVRRLRIDWRVGADFFAERLLDGDVANNYGNWQWVAGTGNDTRPNRTVNHLRQARRFDPEGEYVRRYVPELAAVPTRSVHEPWRLPVGVGGYPAPLVTMD
ncbi:deoxyribodipyrimidine photo-lyase [Streptosporangium becharense]|uniref:Deoxyribodipyrimidine photo-lyase n=1 Tax=Streptosporangium becharense TaxID=1816182 RepID=A0A7W9IEB9_9ACTN|nr:deoxyribodipyrimidine photo-lyase [Streptosporangium becharense]MBB2909895.1 deoxyribodipyrimidine photo-lyase [Streptosporangium becharense]MBB5819150.1 deoxyribodipyrimidine photo-lyase [Streptosporangium becharense]